MVKIRNGGFSLYKINKLKNGIRVVTEKIDYVKSVSVGVWVGAGSAFENGENNGVSHFIEHMLFKGTKTRSAKEIAEYMDSVGGQLNALTAKEYTCYYAKTLTEHSSMSFEILSDMYRNSTFSEENIATERRVISEEINMSEDTPEDAVHDSLSRIMWRESPLGFPIAGTDGSLEKIDRRTMLDYRDRFYCGENTVISVVGNFDEDGVMAQLEEKFGGLRCEFEKAEPLKKINVTRGGTLIKKDIEQCHLCMGLEGLNRNDGNLYDLLVVNALFGGNMSSRLFQRVREEKGLAYSIYSYVNSYKNNGSFVIYAGLNTESICDALAIINKEIRELKKNKLSEGEISVAKEQLKASVIMGLEGMSARMSSYGKSILFDNRIKTADDIVEYIDKVNVNSVADTIDRIFDISRLNMAIIGRLDGDGREEFNIMDF